MESEEEINSKGINPTIPLDMISHDAPKHLFIIVHCPSPISETIVLQDGGSFTISMFKIKPNRSHKAILNSDSL